MAEQLSKKRILVCDDDEILVSFYKRVIKGAGYDVVTAANGDEAIRILQQQPVVLAIIDLLMPVCSGWEVIEFIKNDTKLKNLPIIAVTGLTSSPNELNHVKELCSEIIFKGQDFDVEHFIGLLNRLITG
jgi:CheY-like chemotaxis protein